MNARLVDELRKYANSRVKIIFTDGEIVLADLDLVLEEENAIIFDLVTSNRPDRYEKRGKMPHISAKISDVISCEPMAESTDGVLGTNPLA
jgi:hypothetical protein